jgi:hypothetical protein
LHLIPATLDRELRVEIEQLIDVGAFDVYEIERTVGE